MVPLPVISPHYALRSLSSVASIPHAARLSYHWTACAVNWLNLRRTGGSTCSGQVAQATPDRRLRRTGIFNYCAHGFDFIMLVTGLIYSRLNEAVKSLGKSSISTIDMLIKARHMRMVKHNDQWQLHNTRTKDIALFESVGFTPSLTYLEAI